jgi:hypothetical protein
LILLSAVLLSAQTPAPATLRGSVTDPSGALVPGARLQLRALASGGSGITGLTDPAGRFSFSNLLPGTYTLSVTAPGFAAFESGPIELPAGRPQPLNVRLQIETQQIQLSVSGDTADDTDPTRNGDALVLKGSDIDALPEDPTVLQQELQALSGGDAPAMYVDGFSNGTLPPKNTIREIRINQNPFSARNDTDPVNGVIEIFTKPGTTQLHGSLLALGNTQALNTQDPYVGPQPPYHTTEVDGDLSGPISKQASYVLDFTRHSAATNATVDAVILNSAFAQTAFTEAIPSPSTFSRFSARVDLQAAPKSTVSARYSWTNTGQTNGGVGQLNLASQGFNTTTTTQLLQLSNSQILSPKIVNDTRFQYVRTRTHQTPGSSDPTLLVEGAFTGGGNNSGAFHDNQDSYELQNYLAVQAGKHYLSPGVRLRVLRDANVSRAGYNGEFLFSSLSAYQVTVTGLAQGLTPAQIAAAGGGPSQFSLTTGTPSAIIGDVDLAAFFQDDWKITPRFTLSYGLRYEIQNHISDRRDFAPRLGWAWSLGVRKGKPARYVIRGGSGIFYTRLPSANILQAQRQNGVSQQQFVVANPTFYPTIPAISSFGAQSSPTVYEIDPKFRSPYSWDNTISVDHPLGTLGNLFFNYIYNRGVHTLLTRNINAPLPGTYNPANPTSGVRPLGGTQNIDQYESVGVARTNRFSANINLHTKNEFRLYAYYMLRFRNNDANGGFPSNGYDIGADYGRSAQDIRHNLALGVTAPMLPGRVHLNSFLETNSGVPFNIVTGQDLNGDSSFNDRPAFATDLTRPSVVVTRFGAFDTSPISGQKIIPINYGQGPSQFQLNAQIFREFSFGRPLAAPSARPATASPAPSGKVPSRHKPYVDRRYKLIFDLEAENVANRVNRAPPIGTLGSPLFGQSDALAINTANSSTAGGSANRVITLLIFTRF